MRREADNKVGLCLPYASSMGCTWSCSFCTHSQAEGPWQTKSVNKIIKDITLLIEKHKSHRFVFTDSNFNISSTHVDTLCDELIKNKMAIKWRAHVQPLNIDTKLLSKMKKAGCYYLLWGFESGSNRILRMMKKKGDVKSRIGILKSAKDAGIHNALNLMIRYPYETERDLKQTALLIKKNAHIIDDVFIWPFRLRYGSDMFSNPEIYKLKIKERRYSFLIHDYNWEQIEESNSVQDREKLERMRGKIIDYNYKYIRFKNASLLHKVALRLFGRRAIKIIGLFNK